MLNSYKLSSQLNQLKGAINENHPELANKKDVVFSQYNTRTHVTLQTQSNWYRLTGISYSTQHTYVSLTSSDYYLFKSLKNSLNGKNFNYLEVFESHLEQSLSARKMARFGRTDLLSYLKDRKKVMEQNGFINLCTNIRI